jgi:hypothetical protein
MATWRRTTFTEVPSDSPRLSFSEDGSTCVRKFLVPWSSVANAVEDFLGYASVIANPAGGGSPNNAYISRTTPHAMPGFFQPSMLPFLYATKITSIEGKGHNAGRAAGTIKSNDVTTYDQALLTVVYESLTYDVLDDTDPDIIGTTGFPDESNLTRFVTILPKSNSQYLSLSKGNFKWVGGTTNNTPVLFPPGKIITNWDLMFRWHGVPIEAVASQSVNPDYTASSCFIDAAFGRVNATAFAGYDPGTLLLLGAPMTPHRSATGRRTYDIDFLMKWFKPGHHKIFGQTAANTVGFLEISSDGSAHAINGSTPDGVHVYDVYEFSKLFAPYN